MNPEPSVEDYRAFSRVRIDALNHALEGIDPKKTVSAHKQPDGLYTVVTEAGVTLTLRHDTEANHFFPVSVSDATRTLSVSDFTVSADTP